MEDEDCSVNDEGQIDVRYRGWTEIDTSIWSFHAKVTSLDLSYNRLQSIPKEISKLKRLIHLNCEHNEINTLPETIGRLRALKVLKLNGNKLSTIPDEIGNCRNLTTLLLNENKIELLPQSIGGCLSLEVLKLGNNDLKDLPITIAQLKETLNDVDVTNNPDLAIIPEDVRGDSSAIMWIVGFRHDRTMDVRLIRQSILEMGQLMANNNESIESFKVQIEELEKKRRKLVAEREEIWMFLQFRELRRHVQSKVKEIIQHCKRSFDKRTPRVAVSDQEI
jgi:Leucine-rich repeat (LRR) protein